MNGKWVLQQINLRLSGKMSDKDWAEFQSIVEKATVVSCSLCKDQGYVFTKSVKGETLYRCHCEKGKDIMDVGCAPSDKDKGTPLQLRTFRGQPADRRQKGEWDE